jgi:hypothetical protein
VLQGGVDAEKLAFITGDICEREVLQLFLTFCDGKMDCVQFLEFTKRTKLFCKSRLRAAAINEIFDKYSFKIDYDDDVSYINYTAFRFQIIPEFCEIKKEDVSRVINKLCWIDYSHVTPSIVVDEGRSRANTEKDSTDVTASSSMPSDDPKVMLAVTNIQRMQRGRLAMLRADQERELQSQHNSPLTSRVVQQQVAAQEQVGPVQTVVLTPPRGVVDDDIHSIGSGSQAFSPAAKATPTPSTKTPKLKTPLQRDYTDFDIKKATSREFSLQTTQQYSLKSPLFKKGKEGVQNFELSKDIREEENELITQANPISLQTNLAHIIGEYHHRLEYTPRKDGTRPNDQQQVKNNPRVANKQKPLAIKVDPVSPSPTTSFCNQSGNGSPVPAPVDMPAIDGAAGTSIHKIFSKFAPSGEMTVNDFVRFCYATVLIPFDPPIDFTASQARFIFRQVIAECFNPEANTYVQGIMFGKRIEFEIFWALLIPAIARVKRVSNPSIVDFLFERVSYTQLRRLYSSEEGPAVISLLSTQKEMKSDCSSFKSTGATIAGH